MLHLHEDTFLKSVFSQETSLLGNKTIKCKSFQQSEIHSHSVYFKFETERKENLLWSCSHRQARNCGEKKRKQKSFHLCSSKHRAAVVKMKC